MDQKDKKNPLRTNCPICPKEGKPRRKYRDFWGHIYLEHGLTKEAFRENPEFATIKVHEHDSENTPRPKVEKAVKSGKIVLTVSQEDIDKVC